MALIDNALEYYKAGLSVIPIGENKIPLGAWRDSINKAIEPNGNFINADAIGLCCGVTNVQAIDIDLKYDLTGTLYERYKREINTEDKNLLKKLTVQTTKNKGYHFLFRCSHIGGNTKLASRPTTDEEKKLNPNEKQKVLIETRELGGYVVINPSEGYDVVYGSILDIQTITSEERRVLHDCAKLFNEVVKLKDDSHKIKKQVSDLSPFDDFNERGDIIPFLLAEGWKETRTKGDKILLLRPGGTGKWSAEYDHSKKLFYVWTSSTEFENDKAYNHSQVLAYLRFNQDYSETAKWLISEGYGHKTETVKKKNEPITSEQAITLLDTCRIDLDKEYKQPPTILSVREKQGAQYVYRRLFSLGNFSVIKGRKKSRKTFFLTLIAGMMLKEVDYSQPLHNDVPDDKKIVLYFDTEQSEYDTYRAFKRIVRIAGTKQNFYGFNLRPYSPLERCAIIEEALKKYAPNVGYVVIDGVRDLVMAINDELEATRVTGLYMRWTAEHNCHISIVIHENKGDGNSRGHIGAEIENRSEIGIKVMQHEKDWRVSRIINDFSRSIAFNELTLAVNSDEEAIPYIETDYQPPTEEEEVPF